VTWQRRLVRVDSSRIWIGHPESQVVLDCIPINEIGRVTTKSKTGLEKNRVNRMETQLGFDLDADALFRYALRQRWSQIGRESLALVAARFLEDGA
jgi:hypothetical protein